MISIAIPTYEYKGMGDQILEYSFNIIDKQTYKDFEVVISDHSIDDKIEILCERWKNSFNLKYIRNSKDIGSPASNTNNAIKNCQGEFIKILCQDDFLFDEKSLEQTSRCLSDETYWLVTSYYHSNDRIKFFNIHDPYLNIHIAYINTIGTPSCVTLRNVKNMPEMDTNLGYAYDCEFYYRFLNLYGDPRFLYVPTIVNFLWQNSISHSITSDLIEKENLYIINKHGLK